jgi:ATP synthase protein I
MSTNGDKATDPDLRKRLDALKSDLDKATAESPAAKASSTSTDEGTAKGLSAGLRVMSEFVSGIIVGAGLGWLLDRWLGTSPLFLLAFLALGFGAGFRNVYRLGMGPRPPRQ